ncbi:MAG: response regulator transcription factor [Chitinophagales bacterium]|nr:response regulator transcription factor [Chitinophagales bacterium]
MTILIADDHTIFREGLAALLKNMNGVTAIALATNGADAVQQVSAGNIDIVLMDIEMPEMNGLEATRIIKENNNTSPAVIALTMFNRMADVLGLYDAGVDGYLLKDSSVKEVEKALQFVQEGKEYYCEAVKEVLFKALLQRQRKNLTQDENELTDREKEILLLICEQCSTEEIAAKLFLSPLTINNHRRSILSKTKSKNIAGMVLYALRCGIYSLPTQ